jgi:hypothetical protein
MHFSIRISVLTKIALIFHHWAVITTSKIPLGNNSGSLRKLSNGPTPGYATASITLVIVFIKKWKKLIE